MGETSHIAVHLRIKPTINPSGLFEEEEASDDDNEAGSDNRRAILRWTVLDASAPSHVCGRDGVLVNNAKSRHRFKFDSIIPPTASQASVFETVGKEAVANALSGYNSTVFAYGQTGSGKT